MVNFLTVDVPSAYNVIMGRPSLNLFQVVVSKYHMKLKFPMGDEVGDLAGDQVCSRKCYVETVKRVLHSSPRIKNGEEETAENKMKTVDVIEHISTCQMDTEHQLMSVEIIPGRSGPDVQIKVRRAFSALKVSINREVKIALLDTQGKIGVELKEYDILQFNDGKEPVVKKQVKVRGNLLREISELISVKTINQSSLALNDDRGQNTEQGKSPIVAS